MRQGLRLVRNINNKVIAGVCSGLADYFGIDVALMRVLFVVAFLCGSFGFWLYIILWIVLPAKRLEYYGNGNENNMTDFPGRNVSPDEENQRNTVLVVFSILLIIIGIVLLLNNFVYVAWLWKLWPAILVVIGVILIINSQNKRGGQQ